MPTTVNSLDFNRSYLYKKPENKEIKSMLLVAVEGTLRNSSVYAEELFKKLDSHGLEVLKLHGEAGKTTATSLIGEICAIHKDSGNYEIIITQQLPENLAPGYYPIFSGPLRRFIKPDIVFYICNQTDTAYHTQSSQTEYSNLHTDSGIRDADRLKALLRKSYPAFFTIDSSQALDKASEQMYAHTIMALNYMRAGPK